MRGFENWSLDRGGWKYRKPPTLVRRIPRITVHIEGTEVVWWDKRTDHHEVGTVWSPGPQAASRWIKPFNPELGVDSGCLWKSVYALTGLHEFLRRNPTICRESLYELRKRKVSG